MVMIYGTFSSGLNVHLGYMQYIMSIINFWKKLLKFGLVCNGRRRMSLLDHYSTLAALILKMVHHY